MLDDDSIIYEWCFEFYSPGREEWLDYGYWTLSDDQQSAVELLMSDEENDVEYLSCSLNTWTYKEFKANQGEDSLELIRDLENYMEELHEQDTQEKRSVDEGGSCSCC